MERVEWLRLMNVKCKLLAMAGGFTRAPEHLKKCLERKAVLSHSEQCLSSSVPPLAPVSRFTPIGMAMIDPFRKLVVYPSLLRTVRARWNIKTSARPENGLSPTGSVQWPFERFIRPSI